MSIPDTFHFDKDGEVLKYPRLRPYFLTIIIILISLLSFGVGRLTGDSREGVEINYDPKILSGESLTPTVKESTPSGSVTASSQGTRYYFSHCGNNISEKNKVTFATPLLAEKAGYTLALNCSPR